MNQSIQSVLGPLIAKDNGTIESFRDILKTFVDMNGLGDDLETNFTLLGVQVKQTARTVRSWYTGSIPDPKTRRSVVAKIKILSGLNAPAPDAPTAA